MTKRVKPGERKVEEVTELRKTVGVSTHNGFGPKQWETSRERYEAVHRTGESTRCRGVKVDVDGVLVVVVQDGGGLRDTGRRRSGQGRRRTYRIVVRVETDTSTGRKMDLTRSQR